MFFTASYNKQVLSPKHLKEFGANLHCRFEKRKSHFTPTNSKFGKNDVTGPKASLITTKGKFQQLFASLINFLNYFIEFIDLQ